MTSSERVPQRTLSRKFSAKPSALQLEYNGGDWTTDIVLDTPANTSFMASSPAAIIIPDNKPDKSHPAPRSAKLPKSPCFVHSLLDKGASLHQWLQDNRTGDEIGVSRSLTGLQKDEDPLIEPPKLPMPQPPLSQDSPPSSDSREEDYETETDDLEGASSLTRQLAETAVGVREMSKQLGRARVKANIQSVMIITKARDNRLIKLTRDLALYLMLTPRSGTGRGLTVYVDSQLRPSKRFDAEGIERDHPELFIPSSKRRSSSNTSISSQSSEKESDPKWRGRLRYWTSDMCSRSPELFDFVVTLGGDGTVLFTSWLFQRIVPPVLPFALGSLGFLTNFDFADHQAVMDSAIDSGIRVNLRMRFTCTVYRAVAPEEGKGRKAVKKAETGEIMMKCIGTDGWEALEGGWGGGSSHHPTPSPNKDKEIMCFTTRPVESFEVLNELVVDRGPSPYVSLLELFGDEHHMTTVQADGLTVSTPTGSTAYSLSAGGSLVHPEIPSILITPICPHTLSFRPMLLPDTMELRICVPYNSRSTAWASFDGRGRVELKQGDHIKITASKYPFPTVCADKQSTDWFHSISRTLKWNERQRQKSFVVVEEGPKKLKTSRSKKKAQTIPNFQDGIPEEDVVDNEEEEEEEEEEKFDIDDTFGADSATTTEAKVKAQEVLKTHEEREALRAATAIINGDKSQRRPSISGISTPSRYAGPIPHPRPISPRHISPEDNKSGNSSPEYDERRRIEGEDGDRDDIHSPRTVKESSKSKIPRNRDLEAEIRTPRPYDGYASKPHQPPASSRNVRHNALVRLSRRHRSLSPDTNARRAFAVWGHDESDSNTSDTDSLA